MCLNSDAMECTIFWLSTDGLTLGVQFPVGGFYARKFVHLVEVGEYTVGGTVTVPKACLG